MNRQELKVSDYILLPKKGQMRSRWRLLIKCSQVMNESPQLGPDGKIDLRLPPLQEPAFDSSGEPLFDVHFLDENGMPGRSILKASQVTIVSRRGFPDDVIND